MVDLEKKLEQVTQQITKVRETYASVLENKAKMESLLDQLFGQENLLKAMIAETKNEEINT